MREPSNTGSFDPAVCEAISFKLAGVVDGGESLALDEMAHVGTCLQCQAELVRYRRLLRALHDLRTQVIRPTPGMLADILDRIGEKGEQEAVVSLLTGRRIAYAGGLAVAAVAGVTGAVLLAGRVRHRTHSKAA